MPRLSSIAAPVSFANELLILVDENDVEIGHMDKWEAHSGAGVLHRAFSIFLFDGPESVLLQRRSLEKPLWPGYWSNSCCSHPRAGESYEGAVKRRLREELGAEAKLHRLYQFQYHEPFGNDGAEHELCTVYAGNRTPGTTIAAHASEVMAWDWFDCRFVDEWVDEQPELFTPWFKMEWRMLRSKYRGKLQFALGQDR